MVALAGTPTRPVSQRGVDAPADQAALVSLVTAIQRADYEGDREALRQLHARMQTSARGSLGARVAYWRGFALWRRAFNGFNDKVDRAELELDLRGAIAEFDRALSEDPALVDATIGSISCLQSLAFIHQQDGTAGEFVSRFVALISQVKAAAPDNPRFLWVYGPSQWYAPPETPATEIARRQQAAIATYERGLELARAQKRSADALDPSWGEPELLMSLAWSQLNRASPDRRAAEEYAKQALALVPHWHYVRDILLPQIRRNPLGPGLPAAQPRRLLVESQQPGRRGRLRRRCRDQLERSTR
jgi:tetratricopeptide (TPR) repeat protein